MVDTLCSQCEAVNLWDHPTAWSRGDAAFILQGEPEPPLGLT